MQLVYQNPYASLNPRMSIEQIIADPLVSFGRPPERAADAPPNWSSWWRCRQPRWSAGRRSCPAASGNGWRSPGRSASDRSWWCSTNRSPRSTSRSRPRSSTAGRAAGDLGVAYLFISHDLAVVRQIAHEVGVMRKGTLVETGAADEHLRRADPPVHPAVARRHPRAPWPVAPMTVSVRMRCGDRWRCCCAQQLSPPITAVPPARESSPNMTRFNRARWLAAVLGVSLLAAGCASSAQPAASNDSADSSGSASSSGSATASLVRQRRFVRQCGGLGRQHPPVRAAL